MPVSRSKKKTESNTPERATSTEAKKDFKIITYEVHISVGEGNQGTKLVQKRYYIDACRFELKGTGKSEKLYFFGSNDQPVALFDYETVIVVKVTDNIQVAPISLAEVPE